MHHSSPSLTVIHHYQLSHALTITVTHHQHYHSQLLTITHHRSHSFSIICHNLPSYTAIHSNTRLFSFQNYLSVNTSPITRHYSTSFTNTGHQSPSFPLTHHHLVSFSLIKHHLPSLSVLYHYLQSLIINNYNTP